MLDTSHLIYLHGLESDSNGGKVRQFREWYPGITLPLQADAHITN